RAPLAEARPSGRAKTHRRALLALEEENQRLQREIQRLKAQVDQEAREVTEARAAVDGGSLSSISCTVEETQPDEQKGHYDPVPSDQVGPLVNRLELVAQLMARYGRAYDYRIYTTRELQEILGGLERSRR
ncbi:MAG TPA: hypothetical protein VL588_13235, partial [Bdellovibrionota bacterium]|nr:hypothetical protein [Bdellovibrionota bacterium]